MEAADWCDLAINCTTAVPVASRLPTHTGRAAPPRLLPEPLHALHDKKGEETLSLEAFVRLGGSGTDVGIDFSFLS